MPQSSLQSAGVGSVSLRDIADELGISKGTLHYYFKTKEDLICSCAENCVAVIGDGVFELMNGAARGGSAESVCKKFVSAFFDDASLPKLLVGLLCCECGRAAEICRSAIEEWRVMFEVAALRLSPRSGGQTELSQAANSNYSRVCGSSGRAASGAKSSDGGLGGFDFEKMIKQ